MTSVKGKFKARILDATSMQRALNRIAHQILEHNPNVDELALIGIRNRGVPLAQRLAVIIRGIEGKGVSTGALDIALSQDDPATLPAHPVVQNIEIPFTIDGKTIILVDDVLHTGRTIRAAIDALVEFGKPRAIQLAVLIDRGHRELPIHADYVGKNVPTASNELVHVLLKETDHDEQVLITEN